MNDLWVWAFNPKVGPQGQLENRKVLKYEKLDNDFIAITENGIKIHSEDGWRLSREEALQAAISGMGLAITQNEEMIERNKNHISETENKIENFRKCIAHAQESLNKITK